MGVDIFDRQDRRRRIHASWWQWRPTVERIRSFGVFEDERLDIVADGVGEFSADEAQLLAGLFDRDLGATLKPGDRLLLDGSVTETRDDGVFYADPAEQHRNYGADHAWLMRFIAFCKASGGIVIC